MVLYLSIPGSPTERSATGRNGRQAEYGRANLRVGLRDGIFAAPPEVFKETLEFEALKTGDASYLERSIHAHLLEYAITRKGDAYAQAPQPNDHVLTVFKAGESVFQALS